MPHPAACILLPAACSLHPAACTLHSTSCILYPAACILLPAHDGPSADPDPHGSGSRVQAAAAPEGGQDQPHMLQIRTTLTAGRVWKERLNLCSPTPGARTARGAGHAPNNRCLSSPLCTVLKPRMDAWTGEHTPTYSIEKTRQTEPCPGRYSHSQSSIYFR